MAMKQQQQPPSTSTAATASPAPAKPGGGGGDDDQNQILELVTLESIVPIHATGDVALLSDVRAPAPNEQEEDDEAFFFLGAGVHHRVAALGRLATPRFDVPDVRHVPGLGRPGVVAVSVLELARRGLAVSFRPGSCRVTDTTTGGEIVGEGRMRGGRYYLDYLRVPSRC